jgi:polysaccharide export outer membrane protein
VPGSYRIAAGDTLDVVVWREEQISGPAQVRPDGMITIALAGDIHAAGLTPEELAAQIQGVLSRFIDNPNVVVRVSAMGSRRFFVMGNVKTPGMYDLRPGETLIQALAVAGGFTEFANRGHVKLMRTGASPTERDYDAIVAGAVADVPLEPNDTIVVP